MKCQELKKEIERLEDELCAVNRKLCNLHVVNLEYEGEVEQLRAELADTKGKYAALLEKYIAMMEKAANLYNPGDQVLLILEEIDALIFKWMRDNAYDYQLENGVKELRKKYTEV